MIIVNSCDPHWAAAVKWTTVQVDFDKNQSRRPLERIEKGRRAFEAQDGNVAAYSLHLRDISPLLQTLLICLA